MKGEFRGRFVKFIMDMHKVFTKFEFLMSWKNIWEKIEREKELGYIDMGRSDNA